jgi:glycosyltransferase involved in cell wall biosynthesis
VTAPSLAAQKLETTRPSAPGLSLIRTSSAAVSVGDARSPRTLPVPLAEAGSWLAGSRVQIAFGRNAKHGTAGWSGRAPGVSAPGFVDDVRPYLGAAEVYLCPIRDGGGTRLKVLDALSSGLPLVATALAVEGLGMSDGRHYLRAEMPADYVECVRRLGDEPELRARLCAEGRALVEQRFAWSAVGKRLEAAYDRAVSA